MTDLDMKNPEKTSVILSEARRTGVAEGSGWLRITGLATASVIVLTLVLAVAIPASAAPPPTGTCKEACTADEVDLLPTLSIIPGMQQLLGCTPQKPKYCVAKGTVACKWAADASSLQNGNCNSPCTQLALTTKGYPELCPGATVCCATMPGESKTLGGETTTIVTGKGAIPSSITLTNPLGAGSSFFTIISRLITAFLGIVGGLALLVFVYAGIMWMTAGSSDRVQKAKDAMKYAVIGLALIAFSYVITSFVVRGLTGQVTAPTETTEPEYALPSEPNP